MTTISQKHHNGLQAIPQGKPVGQGPSTSTSIPTPSTSKTKPIPSTTPIASSSTSSHNMPPPKVRLKVSSTPATTTPSSHINASLITSQSRPRPPVKYHYPIILDDDEDDEEDDGSDGEWAGNDGTFSSQRKRKDTIQAAADVVRKGTADKGKRTGKQQENQKDLKGKASARVDVNREIVQHGEASHSVRGNVVRDDKTASIAKSKKKNQKLASIERNSARREKLNSGLGNSHTSLKEAAFGDDSDELSSLPDEYKSEDEAVKVRRDLQRERRRKRQGHKRCSCHKHSHHHRRRHHDIPAVPESTSGIFGGDAARFPSGPPQMFEDEPQLPEGVDPTNVEDVFLDVAPVNQAWSTDEEDDEILFAALDEFEDAAQTDEAEVEDSDATEDDTSATFSSDSDDDDYNMDDEFGFGPSSNLPLVLMEDWSGNLVFAQPVIDAQEEARQSRGASKSRSRGSRLSGKGSKGSSGSTINGEGPALLMDAEAFETEGDGYEDGMSDGGDTTDSLPEEDMPSPPDIIPFSLAAAGLEANNAAFGITTVDEAALARDLGLPLADARHLLERARAEEQQHGIGNPNGGSPVAEPVPGAGVAEVTVINGQNAATQVRTGIPTNTSSTESSRHSSSALDTTPASQDLSPGLSTAVSPAPSANLVGGLPIMGSFMQDVADPERIAVIDGTGKTAPSPFIRRTVARGRSKGTDRSSAKKRAFGRSPAASPVGRPRYSSVPASSRFGAMRGSPLHPSTRNEPFEREDTPSDMEMMIEPISLDDVLDIDAMHHYSHEIDHASSAIEGLEPPRHLRNLQRWERVPITTFRRSRHHGEAIVGSPGQQPNVGPFRGSFTSPSMASTLAGASTGPLGYPHGMIVSPILEAVHEQPYRDDSQIRRRKSRKPALNGTLARNRTSSLGSMPPINLGR